MDTVSADFRHTFVATEHPRDLARHAIRLLEQQLYKKFSVTLTMGAELEFSLFPCVNTNHGHAIHYEKRRGEQKLDKYAPANRKTPWQNADFYIPGIKRMHMPNIRDPLFPESPIICYSYMEEEEGKYEAVLSHKAHCNHEYPNGNRALLFARSIEATQHTILHSDVHKGRYAANERHHGILQRLAQKWQPTLDAYCGECPNDYEERTHGLHLNITLKSKGRDVPNQFYLAEKALRFGIGGTMTEGAYLLLAEPTCEMRLKERIFGNAGAHHTYIKSRVTEGDNGDHHTATCIELQSPAATSDPYYAVMMALAGIYYTLAQGRFDSQKGVLRETSALQQYAKYRPSNVNPNYAKRFFRGEQRIVSILNQLGPASETEEALGDRFKAAIIAHPPTKTAKTLQLESPAQLTGR